MSFVTKLAQQGNIPVFFFTCVDVAGNDCYYYIQTNENNMRKLNNTKVGNINISEYGKILASGVGKVPPQDVKNFIENYFN